MLTTGLNIMQQARLKSLMKENGDDTDAEAIAGYERALGCAPGVLQPFLFPEETDTVDNAGSDDSGELAEANANVGELTKALADANETYANALEEANSQIKQLTDDNLAHSNAAVDAKTASDKVLKEATDKIADLEAKLKEKAVVKK